MASILRDVPGHHLAQARLRLLILPAPSGCFHGDFSFCTGVSLISGGGDFVSGVASVGIGVPLQPWLSGFVGGDATFGGSSLLPCGWSPHRDGFICADFAEGDNDGGG